MAKWFICVYNTYNTFQKETIYYLISTLITGFHYVKNDEKTET